MANKADSSGGAGDAKGAGQAPTLQELRAARGGRPSFARRNRGWLVAGGVVVFLILFGFFGLPPIVKAKALKELSARLGREVTIEKVRINPLVLSVTVEGFSVAEAGAGAGEFTGWKRLHVNVDSWALVTGKIGFQEIALDGFRARVAKGKEGAFNFDDIVAKLTAGEKAGAGEKEKAAGEVPAVVIGRLAVTDARVDFSDASRARPFEKEVGPLGFELRDFHTVGDPDAPYSFEAKTTHGERFAWTGTVSMDPVKSQGTFALENIDLARLGPYYHERIAGELRSAFLDVAGGYTLAMADGLPAVTLKDGAVTLRDVRFGGPGVEADALTLRRVAVTGIGADSATMRAEVAKVAVEGVGVKVIRDAEGIDLLRWVTPVATGGAGAAGARGGKEAGMAAGGAMPVVTLGELVVAGVQVEAVDLTTRRRAEHRVEDLTLSLRGLDTAQLGKSLEVALAVTLPGDGKMAVGGTVALAPLAADLDVALERVRFANVSPYVEPFVNVRLADGSIRAKGKATLREGAAGFAGDAGVAGLHVVDGKLAEDFLRWADFSITGIRAGSAPLAFHADEIRLVEPTATVRVEADGTLSIAQAAEDAGRAVAAVETAAVAYPAAGVKAQAAPVAATVGRVVVERGAFRFEDRSVKPAARTALTDFSGTVAGLSSEALGRADVQLSGKVDGVAPVVIAGKVNPLGTPAFVDLIVDFDGIDLQPGAGPYVAKFVGRELARGSLSVAIQAKLNDRKVDAKNVVTLGAFDLGAKTDSPEATKLPVGLALALLRDTQGRIVIDLPVKGSLDDPSFKIGRVVLRVVTNILAKAATSPFSLLGAAFGGGGDELGWQDFAAGETEPDAGGIQKLETVAKALNGRPSLRLELAGTYAPDADKAALRAARLEREVRVAAWETRRLVDPNTPAPEAMEITPELRAGMVAKLYAAAFPAEAGVAAVEAAGGARVVGTEAVEAKVVGPVGVAAGLPSAIDLARRRAAPAAGQVGRLRKYGTEAVGGVTGGAGGGAAGAVEARVGEVSVAYPGAATTAAAGADAGPSLAEMEARLATKTEVADAELEAIGAERAQAVRSWLVETGKVAPERILVGPVAAKGTRMTLTLQ